MGPVHLTLDGSVTGLSSMSFQDSADIDFIQLTVNEVLSCKHRRKFLMRQLSL